MYLVIPCETTNLIKFKGYGDTDGRWFVASFTNVINAEWNRLYIDEITEEWEPVATILDIETPASTPIGPFQILDIMRQKGFTHP